MSNSIGVLASRAITRQVMGRGRQRDHSVTLATSRAMKWRAALRVLMARRHLPSPSSTSAVLMHCIKRCTSEQSKLLRFSERPNRISLSSFSFNFNVFTDVCGLSLFGFRKQDAIRMVTAIAWKGEITTMNRYMCSPHLVTRVVLRRLTTPARSRDIEMQFGKHGGQPSEIFWEGMERFLEARQHLVLSDIDSTFFSERAEL